MANTLENTLNKVGNAIESVLTPKSPTTYAKSASTTGQSNLERFGREARREHILRNEWRNDLGYSKPLVDAEYLIQTEFKVSSLEDRLVENTRENKLNSEIGKLEQKINKAQEKINKLNEKKRKMLLDS